MTMKLTYTLILLLSCLRMQAQKNINLIVTIDNQIVIGSMSGVKLLAVDTIGRKDSISADYYPGNLSIGESAYQKLNSAEIQTIYLLFDYIELKGDRMKNYSYQIDLKKGWLKNYFHIVHIYNLSKKEFRQLFSAYSGKSYIYEFDYPGGSTKLIRSRK